MKLTIRGSKRVYLEEENEFGKVPEEGKVLDRVAFTKGIIIWVFKEMRNPGSKPDFLNLNLQLVPR